MWETHCLLHEKADEIAPKSFVFDSLENHRQRPRLGMQEIYIKHAASQVFGGDRSSLVLEAHIDTKNFQVHMRLASCP